MKHFLRAATGIAIVLAGISALYYGIFLLGRSTLAYWSEGSVAPVPIHTSYFADCVVYGIVDLGLIAVVCLVIFGIYKVFGEPVYNLGQSVLAPIERRISTQNKRVAEVHIPLNTCIKDQALLEAEAEVEAFVNQQSGHK